MDSNSQLADKVPALLLSTLYNQQRTLLQVSAAASLLTGYDPIALLQQHPSFTDLIHSEDRTRVAEYIKKAAGEKRSYDITYRIKTAAGQDRWVREQGQVQETWADSSPILNAVLTDYHDQMIKIRVLRRRVADRSGRLAALYDILEAVSDAATLPATCARILQRLLQAVALDAGAIHLLQQGSAKLQLIAHEGLTPDLSKAGSSMPMGESALLDWIAANRRPLLIPQLNQDQRAQTLAQNSPFTLFAGVPIIASDHLYGVLSLFSLQDRQARVQEAMDLLLSVGEQIGVVVENAKLREDAQQLQIVEERNRLARELHDSVTQSLYSVTLFAEAGRRMLAQGDIDQAAVYLTDVAQTGRQALKEMRLLVHRLRPTILAQEGLLRAVQHRLNAVEGRAGVTHKLQVEGQISFPAPLEDALYHIIQEALNNALKHSVADRVTVALHVEDDGRVDLKISDNGRGFESQGVEELGGLGITSMRERAQQFGGRLTCSSPPGAGTTIHVQLPPQAAQEHSRSSING